MPRRFHAITRPKEGEGKGRREENTSDDFFFLSLSFFSFHRGSRQFRFLTGENRIGILFIFYYHILTFLRYIY